MFFSCWFLRFLKNDIVKEPNHLIVPNICYLFMYISHFSMPFWLNYRQFLKGDELAQKRLFPDVQSFSKVSAFSLRWTWPSPSQWVTMLASLLSTRKLLILQKRSTSNCYLWYTLRNKLRAFLRNQICYLWFDLRNNGRILLKNQICCLWFDLRNKEHGFLKNQ